MSRKEAPDRQYTDEFKIEAVRLAESIGPNQAAKRLGMPESSLGNWVRLNEPGGAQRSTVLRNRSSAR